MAARQTLTLFVRVQILLPQPERIKSLDLILLFYFMDKCIYISIDLNYFL